jgi:hypothetical protein
MTRALLAVARALLAIARAITRGSMERMCCSEHAIVVEHKGRLWWRLHEWNANRWAPLGTPGESPEPVSYGSTTDQPKPARPARVRGKR